MPLRAVPALLCLIAALLGGGRAFAHAQLVSADPAEGAVIGAAPNAVALTFSEPVRPLAVRWFASGDAAPVEVVPSAGGERLLVPVPEGIGTGTLLLSWRVVSADGHPIAGSHVFSIGAPTAAAAPRSEGAARGAAIARGLLTLVLVFGVGGAVFLRVVDREATPLPATRQLALWAARATLPVAVLAVGVQGLDLLGAQAMALLEPAPWAAALTTPFATMATVSLLAGLAAAAALRRHAGGQPLAIVAWGLAAISFALFGHAATAPPRGLTCLAVALHAGAAMFWIGALPGLAERAAQRGGALVATLHRFSSLAVPLVATLVASGSALAVVQVRDSSLLLSTAYGRLLVAKLAAVAILLGLAVLNRFRLTPAIAAAVAGAPARFRRSVSVEIVLALLVLALAAGFRLTPPPRLLAAAPAEVHVHMHGPTLTAGVTLEPGSAGANDAEIAITDETGAPAEPLEVEISFADAARGVEPIRLDASRDGEVWRAGPVQLPHGGDWTIGLDVLVSDFDKASLGATATLNAR